MNESIYSLVPVAYIPKEKPPMYRSRHDPKAPVSASTFGCTGTTRIFGAGQVPKKEGAHFGVPADHLRTMKRSPKKTTSMRGAVGTASPGKDGAAAGSRFMYTDRRKGAVPSPQERPVMGITTTKNFVTANAVEAILQVPRNINKGDLDYSKKEDFGRVPSYLEKVKEEIRRENAMIERYVKEQMGEVEQPPQMYEEMTEEERQDLLHKLKEKWDHVNSNYQKITHLVRFDTAGHVRRKESMEAEMSQLEADIERLQAAKNILITK